MVKCDIYDPDYATDSDCAGDAFFFSYEVAVVATLNDGELTSNDQLRFTVTFGPDCRNDQVSFRNPIDPVVVHYITGPPSQDVYDPVLMQTIVNCPVTCALSETNDPSVIDFSTQTGAITISGYNIFQDMLETQLTITCTSDKSLDPSMTSVSNTFTV